LTEIIKGNMFVIYISSLFASGLTFVFWILASNWTNPESIGTVSVITTFSLILVSISSIEISQGMRRYVSKAAAENKWSQVKEQTASTLIFSIISSTGILLVANNPFLDIFEIIGIDKQYVPIIIMVVFSVGIQQISSSVLVSTLKSKWLFIPTVISYSIRIPLLFIFLMIFEDQTSVAWSYSLSFLIIAISVLFIVLIFLKRKEGIFIHDIKNNLSLMLKASFPRWIPTVINVVGTQVGLLAVFSIKGNAEGGLFYIPFAVFNVLMLFASSINSVNLTVFSSVKNSKQNAEMLQKTLKITFLVTLPIAGVMFFYASSIMEIFGKEFIVSSSTLGIFILSFPLVLISEGIFHLLYAKAEDKKILLLGLFGTIPRLILYSILVPEFGGAGAATSIVIGSIFQMSLTLWYIKKIELKLPFKQFIIISIIPFVIGYGIDQINIGIIGSVLVFVLSYVVLLRLHIIKENEIEMIFSIIFKNKSTQISKKLCFNLKKIHLM
jgi:O-antigen/teichoic acid export membrane protein